jgi:hypothetical protein
MVRLTPIVACFVLALVAAIVSVDVVFFRHQFAERLIANVAIVVVFGAVYFIFPPFLSSAEPVRLDGVGRSIPA